MMKFRNNCVKMNVSSIVSSSGEPSTSSMSTEIYLLKRMESHCLELDSLNTECRTKSPKLMSQRLPRFMRRRAASHNPKRVPKYIQRVIHDSKPSALLSTHSKKKKTNNKKKKHINERKHELSVKRRNEKKERTILHIWFAKRFKMKVYFNRLTPIKNCTKNERLLYRNSKQDFVFNYLSIYNCIEIDYSMSGRQQLVNIGCTFGAKLYESGNREGMTVLYAYESYPLKPLVSTAFLWNQSFSKLWIWSHISVYDKVIQLLIECSQQYFPNEFKFIDRSHQLESESAKSLWNKITENRGHRVGGLHDLQMISLNTSSLLFPEFGFIDVDENETKVAKLKTLLNSDTEEPFYVIRNASILSKLSKDLRSNILSDILDSIEKRSNALINVEIVCVGRGVPQEFDYICIPNETEIENIIRQIFIGNIGWKGFGSKESSQTLNEFEILECLREDISSHLAPTGLNLNIIIMTGTSLLSLMSDSICWCFGSQQLNPKMPPKVRPAYSASAPPCEKPPNTIRLAAIPDLSSFAINSWTRTVALLMPSSSTRASDSSEKRSNHEGIGKPPFRDTGIT
ncbi:unnamed protein product [Medioppia subpectinata]|uniref:Pop1 N-terminal domain-containing protein n=1 Tax=Medioppia subpectinata TaxID=1979941 RepID=A0A7R9KPW0_9ACAR|nr:unnamed protein product [Medioppia subpectinata]CAG2107486.1 unnamed protein product [Medioppia subpectinata]